MLTKIITILILIESGGKAGAIGDDGRAVGVLQIHPVMVDEANRILGRREFTYQDRTDRDRSIQIAAVFLSYQAKAYRRNFGKDPRPEDLSVCWNTGSLRRDNWAYQQKFLRAWEGMYETEGVVK
jgi:hypothetical protein